MRQADYGANLLNQYTNRTVPGCVNVVGDANSNATVTLWSAESLSAWTPTVRRGDYWRGEVAVNNSTGAIWLTLTNLAVLNDGSNPDIVTNVTGRVFVSKTPESFGYDANGNLTQDGRWNYTWDGESRLVKVESRTTTPLASRRKVEWQYDALGRRIRQTTSDGSSGTWQVTEDLKFVSDPVLFGRHIAELNATNNALLRTYVWGLDLSGSLDGAGAVAGLLFVTQHSTPQPSTHFVAYDGNGNVMALIAAIKGSVNSKIVM